MVDLTYGGRSRGGRRRVGCARSRVTTAGRGLVGGFEAHVDREITTCESAVEGVDRDHISPSHQVGVGSSENEFFPSRFVILSGIVECKIARRDVGPFHFLSVDPDHRPIIDVKA